MDCARCEIKTPKNALKRYKMAKNANKFDFLGYFAYNMYIENKKTFRFRIKKRSLEFVIGYMETKEG